MHKCLIRISMKTTWFLHPRKFGNEGCRMGVVVEYRQKAVEQGKKTKEKKMCKNGKKKMKKLAGGMKSFKRKIGRVREKKVRTVCR